MPKFLAAASIAALALSGAAVAQSQPTLNLAFIEPTGTVVADVPIDVWVRLTVDPMSDTGLTLDTASPGAGLDVDPLFEPSGMYLNVFFTCTSTFTQSCIQGPPYDFTFGVDALDPVRPSFVGLQSLQLAPGQSRDFFFGQFVPSPSPAPAGDYIVHNVGFTANLFGQYYEEIPVLDDEGNFTFDEFGNQITERIPLGDSNAEFEITLAYTCNTFEASCAFQRTVVPVPEPGTYAMMGLGLGVLGWAARRRRT
jgi:hypothetical protein